VIIVDTGILLAVANRADRWHTRAVEVFVAHRHEMLVPAPVVIESAWLIARDLGNTAEAGFVAAAQLQRAPNQDRTRGTGTPPHR
jgi:uncharacterized protein